MTLSIDNLRYPDWNEARHVTWDGRLIRDLGDWDSGDNQPTFSYTEASTVAADGTAVTLVWRNGDVYGFQSAGDNELHDYDDANEWVADADSEDKETWRQSVLDAVENAHDEGAASNGVDGPQMNFIYLVTADTDPDTSARWAAAIGDLPLCVVELDDYTGLALTGGGMDLSWEIAEAFIRIGYYPPLGPCSHLPGMAGINTPVTGDREAIVRAVITHLHVEAERSLSAAARLREQFLSVNA